MRRPGDTDGPGGLTRLEQRVLAALLPANDPVLAPLANQARAASALGRSFSGVGFMTRIDVPSDLPAAGAPAVARLRPLRARHPALREPVEFLLELRAGRLATLEAFCGDGYWPDDEDAFQLAG